MRIIIKQKYFSLNNKYQIKDTDGNVILLAERQWDRMMSNVLLFKPEGESVARVQFELRKLLTSSCDLLDARGNLIFNVDQKLPFWKFCKAYTINGARDIKIKTGPIHMKAMMMGEDGKYDKKSPVVKVRKKILAIGDTYVVDIAEDRITSVEAMAIALWYEIVIHGNKH